MHALRDPIRIRGYPDGVRILNETRRPRAVELSNRLREDFSADELQRVAAAIPQCVEADQHPAATLLIEFLCETISEIWDGPVPTSEAEELQARLSPPIRAALAALSAGDQTRIWGALDRAATAVRSGLAEGR